MESHIKGNRYVWDIETDGLLDTVSVVHCIVLEDIDTGEVFSYDSTTGNIEDAVSRLLEAKLLIGHNTINFDAPVLNKLYNFNYQGEVIDTLVLSQMLLPHIADIDYNMIRKGKRHKDTFVVWDSNKQKEVSAVGRHSLESWGRRLGAKKDTFGRGIDWATVGYSEEMLMYCKQDVHVNLKLYHRLMKRNVSIDALKLEMKVAEILQRQMTVGWKLDMRQAEEFYATLLEERYKILEEIEKTIEGKTTILKTPAYYTCGDVRGTTKKECEDKVYSKGGLTRVKIKSMINSGPLRTKYTPFNARSGQQIVELLKTKYSWIPTVFTESGLPSTTEEVLAELPWDECKLILKYKVIADRLTKLAEGKHPYMGVVDSDDRVHGRINSVGATTCRATHSKPNIGAVPKVKKDKLGKVKVGYDGDFGKECRELFIAKDGYVIVGADACSQEARCLGHELAFYDGGRYAAIVSDPEGDIHTSNMSAFEISDRDLSKTLMYCINYGGGHEKIGCTASKNPQDVEGNKKLGRKLKSNLMKNLPAFKSVVNKYKDEYEGKEYILGIDNRKIHCRSSHSTLNFKLQSTGAIICKRWMVIIDRKLKEKGWLGIARQVAFVHDELSIEAREDIAEEVAKIMEESMIETEEYYQYQCPLRAEAKVGRSWFEVH